MMRWLSFCLLVVLVFSSVLPVRGAPPDPLEGKWTCMTNATRHLSFCGNRIGCRSNGDAASWFRYASPATNVMVLHYGNGVEEQVAYSLTSDALSVTDSNQVTVAYAGRSLFTNACAKGVLQIEGAQAVCMQDDPQSFVIPIPALLQYLESMPACPNGGTYLLQPGQEPTCSMGCGQ